jgi:hypothetical protein
MIGLCSHCSVDVPDSPDFAWVNIANVLGGEEAAKKVMVSTVRGTVVGFPYDTKSVKNAFNPAQDFVLNFTVSVIGENSRVSMRICVVFPIACTDASEAERRFVAILQHFDA